jgi:hypothetical protein
VRVTTLAPPLTLDPSPARGARGEGNFRRIVLEAKYSLGINVGFG